jgi:hypothetical protein
LVKGRPLDNRPWRRSWPIDGGGGAAGCSENGGAATRTDYGINHNRVLMAWALSWWVARGNWLAYPSSLTARCNWYSTHDFGVQGTVKFL